LTITCINEDYTGTATELQFSVLAKRRMAFAQC